VLLELIVIDLEELLVFVSATFSAVFITPALMALTASFVFPEFVPRLDKDSVLLSNIFSHAGASL
jgi:hypothetical protein